LKRNYRNTTRFGYYNIRFKPTGRNAQKYLYFGNFYGP